VRREVDAPDAAPLVERCQAQFTGKRQRLRRFKRISSPDAQRRDATTPCVADDVNGTLDSGARER